MYGRFTGKHMTAILVAFFGVVIAVNFVMARFAVGTFGGTVVKNSYVASQQYNDWLEAARKQRALGWTANLGLNAGRVLTLTLTKAGTSLDGANVAATASHPLGRANDIRMLLREVAPGVYIADRALPAGRWQVQVWIERHGRTMKLLETVR